MDNKDNKYLVPDHLLEPLRALGLEREFILWQDATDFLREKHATHIIIYPQETMTPPYYVFDFTVVSPYGEPWENDKKYTDYYEALGIAIELCVNDINEAHGNVETESIT